MSEHTGRSVRTVRPAKRLRGTIAVPGDKSISHRAAIFNALADGDATVHNFLDADDCRSTLGVLRDLGVECSLDGGVLFLTGDHGCDPTTPGTDHTRERTPLLATGLEGGPYDIGDRDTYADLGATVAELLGVPWDLKGSSFAGKIGR